MLYIGIAY